MRSYLNVVLIGAMLGAAAAIYWQDCRLKEVAEVDRGRTKRNMRRVLNII